MAEPVIELTAEERDLITHSLGLQYKKKPYRNYFCANIDDIRLERLTERGLMERGGTINEGKNRYYYVTEMGAKAVGTKLPKD